MSYLIGQSLGRYHVLEQLGEGGMATVYKAYDTRLERDVAVKVIRVDQFAPAVLERILKRFEREAKALARLTHPNIVHVNDYGEEDGIPYLVMDYLPGGTLKQMLGRPMPWREAMKLLLPVAEALSYAHSQGIIHRDVKPSNILLTQSGQPMLTDFGIAKLLENEETQTLTGTGAGVGTPEYMAPEQIDGRSVDQRADIYSLGVVLYEMITGRKPFQADTPMAVLIMQARDPLPRPVQFVPGLPEIVEKVLLKVMAKQPDDRYQDMAAFGFALEDLLVGQGQPSAPRPRLDDSRATIEQEATRDELPPASSTPVGQIVPPSLQTKSTNSPVIKKRTWWPWVAGAGGLVALLGIGLAMGGGLLKMGQQGQGPLAALATYTRTTTSTTTPTHTPSKTPTFTITQTPSLTFTLVSTRASSITPSYTPFPTSARVHITIYNSASNPRYVFVDGVQVAYVYSGSSAVFGITAGFHEARACTDAAGSSCGNTKGFTWYFNKTCSIDWGDEMIYCH
jgi:serine/threonine protein kinase